MQAIESHCVWSSGSPGTEPIVLRAMDSSREHARDLGRGGIRVSDYLGCNRRKQTEGACA